MEGAVVASFKEKWPDLRVRLCAFHILKLVKHGRVWYDRDRGCLVNPTVASFFQYYHSIKKFKIVVTTH